MNAKIFSILVGILIALIVALGGTYYYLFEYPKTQKTAQKIEQKTEQISENMPDAVQTEHQEKNAEEPLASAVALANTDENNASKEQSQEEDNKNDKKEVIAAPSIVENEKEQTRVEKPQSTHKESKKSEKKPTNKKILMSTIKEYQKKGKDSRLEPELSSDTIKVYVMDGRALSAYRIDLLKDMLEPVQARSKDYNLSVFIQILPKHEMKISIYNKDIIFSDMKKAYKHIQVQQIAPYLSDPENLNSNVKREEIIERIAFEVEENTQGSDFSRHIKGLKRGLETAQYFFPFCEIIEISAKSKKNKPKN